MTPTFTTRTMTARRNIPEAVNRQYPQPPPSSGGGDPVMHHIPYKFTSNVERLLATCHRMALFVVGVRTARRGKEPPRQCL